MTKQIQGRALRVGLDCYEQFKTMADEAKKSFTHAQRVSNVAGALDFVVSEQKQSLERLAGVVHYATLAFTAQAAAMANLATLMQWQEKMQS